MIQLFNGDELHVSVPLSIARVLLAALAEQDQLQATAVQPFVAAVAEVEQQVQLLTRAQQAAKAETDLGAIEGLVEEVKHLARQAEVAAPARTTPSHQQLWLAHEDLTRRKQQLIQKARNRAARARARAVSKGFDDAMPLLELLQTGTEGHPAKDYIWYTPTGRELVYPSLHARSIPLDVPGVDLICQADPRDLVAHALHFKSVATWATEQGLPSAEGLTLVSEWEGREGRVVVGHALKLNLSEAPLPLLRALEARGWLSLPKGLEEHTLAACYAGSQRRVSGGYLKVGQIRVKPKT
ncbi:MAG: hypothetical protein H0T73_19490 [Ardenticatenales bacterium]|nr:hypothetical protein [Ardenticatenales bacterium]